MQMVAANSSFVLSKVHLKVIFEILASSPVQSDMDEFLKWCKTACENNMTEQVVNLNDFGEFFSQQISSGVFDLRSMPLSGFFFIQMFFVSSNVAADKLYRAVKPKKKKAKEQSWASAYLSSYNNDDDDEKDDDESACFGVCSNPAELLNLDIIWQVVLES